MTEVERAAYRQQIKKAQEQAKQEREQEQQRAAEEAKRILSSATDDPVQHHYSVTKKVSFGSLVKRGAWPQRSWKDALIIPLYDSDGQVTTVQAINEDGKKDFLSGGKKQGCFHPFGKIRGHKGMILLGEGLATVAAGVKVMNCPGVMAVDAGNLLPVAKEIKKLAPQAEIIFLADDDQAQGKEGNPGIEASEKAAQAMGGKVAYPQMGKKADFWDLRHEHGADAVKAAIEKARAMEEKQKENNTPVNPSNFAALVQELAGLSLIEYELKRKATVDALGIRATVLDSAVKEARKKEEGTDLPFEEPEPWREPVDPEQLLDSITTAIQRFIVCPDEVAYTVALWSAMSWFMDIVQVAPLAVITAPEKRCGKSQLLFLIGKLSARSITASSISPAALYRAVDLWKPTLLIDEADAFLKDNEELRGIINSGHTRDSAYVIRAEGDNHIPTKFNTWGAKAIAGIGRIADTLMDRAVVLELRRKLPHENVERLRHAEPDLFSNLCSKLARFAEDYREHVRLSRPPLPEALNDRAQDNWEPLLAIAMVAGNKWLKIGTEAALKISGAESDQRER